MLKFHRSNNEKWLVIYARIVGNRISYVGTCTNSKDHKGEKRIEIELEEAPIDVPLKPKPHDTPTYDRLSTREIT